MLWLITLLVLAVAAFFVVKMMKSNTQKQQAEHDQLQRDRLDSVTAPDESIDASHESGIGTVATDSTESALNTTAATAAAAAGVTQAGMTTTETAASSPADSRIASGDTLNEVREMIKILNLDGPDAARLQIERDQLVALRKGDTEGIPDAATLDSVASKLRNMLA